MTSFAPLVGIILVAIVVSRTVKVAQDQERFAVFNIGKYDGLKGPGLLFKIFSGTSTWLRVRLGDRGEVVAPEFIRIDGHDLPLTIARQDLLGKIARITAFHGDKLQVEADPRQQRLIVCEKCGHENFVS